VVASSLADDDRDVEAQRVQVRPQRASGAVASVGAKPSSRDDWVGGVNTVDGTVYNLGGTPTAWGLLRGRLAASVLVAPTKQWDAVHVLLASQAGATVLHLESGSQVTPARVLEWFSTPQFEDGTGADLVPACIVAVDVATADVVMRALAVTADPVPADAS
jgi:hypothetical protein